METFFQYEIFENVNNRCLETSGANTLEESKNKAIESAKYYHDICGYFTRIDICEVCSECYNVGKVLKYNKRNKHHNLISTWVKCPDCRGNHPTYKESIIS